MSIPSMMTNNSWISAFLIASNKALWSSLSGASRMVSTNVDGERFPLKRNKFSPRRDLRKVVAIGLALSALEERTIWWSSVWAKTVEIEPRVVVAVEQKKYSTELFGWTALSLAAMMCEDTSVIPQWSGPDSQKACELLFDSHCVKSWFLVIQKYFGSFQSRREIVDRCLSWSATDSWLERISQLISLSTRANEISYKNHNASCPKKIIYLSFPILHGLECYVFVEYPLNRGIVSSYCNSETDWRTNMESRVFNLNVPRG